MRSRSEKWLRSRSSEVSEVSDATSICSPPSWWLHGGEPILIDTSGNAAIVAAPARLKSGEQKETCVTLAGSVRVLGRLLMGSLGGRLRNSIADSAGNKVKGGSAVELGSYTIFVTERSAAARQRLETRDAVRMTLRGGRRAKMSSITSECSVCKSVGGGRCSAAVERVDSARGGVGAGAAAGATGKKP